MNTKIVLISHQLVMRKYIKSKIKSPLTNHKNNMKGIIKGGFNRKNLFQQVEKSFNIIFGYDRQLT